ncbi:hypothetical protein PM082_004279 [Marasmius tenuissimus]|nr:hypothetical protein PM082_004279 [Marasmius tenuissimus]
MLESKDHTTDKAWEAVMKRVDAIDAGMEQGWKEDIDTLLVFAGLFSAVVTAFTVESYQWLSEDPSDQTVLLLTQISAQLNGRHVTTESSKVPSFTPSPSVIRINAFWFLSLTLGLVDALFGLMRKQWLREYRRATNTQTPEQWLTLRCFRSDSFERWHVASLLAALPIILELALFSFLAGALELLWMQHRIPFAVAAIVIGSAVAFYIATTLLPGIDIIRHKLRIHPGLRSIDDVESTVMWELPDVHYLCPYKSPQAWAVFRLLSYMLGPSSPLSRPIVSYFLQERFYGKSSIVPERSILVVIHSLYDLVSWVSADLDVIESFSQATPCPDFYEIKAYRWLVCEFRDSPSMIPHLRRLLQVLPPELVMPTVFDCAIVRPDRDWNTNDVERELDGLPLGLPIRSDDPFVHSRTHIRLLFYHRRWTLDPQSISYSSPPFSWSDCHLLTLKEHQAPITRVLSLISDGDQQSTRLALNYIDQITQYHANLYRVYEELDAVASAMIPFLQSLATANLQFLETKEPLFDLVMLINNRSIQELRHEIQPRTTAYNWIDAVNVFRVGQGLSRQHFPRHPGCFPVSLDRLNLLLGDTRTKSLALELMDDFLQAFDSESTRPRLSQLHFLGTVQDYLT